MKEQAKRVCSYLVNARKKPKKKKNENKYSYNVRYYFTSAKVTLLDSQTVIQYFHRQSEVLQKKHTGAHKSEIKTDTTTTQVEMTTGLTVNQTTSQVDAIDSILNATVKVAGSTKPIETVALVCLGDSRGFVHMNHLILK